MKRLPFWLTTLLTTFSFGILIFAVWHFYSTPLYIEVSAPRRMNGVVSNSLLFPGRSVAIDSIKLSKFGFFPENLLEANDDINGFANKNRLYSLRLRKMDEPFLPVLFGKNAEVYRFSWLPNLNGYNSIVIRVERKESQFHLIFKELNSFENETVLNQTRVLSEYESGEFLALLEDADYWKLPTNETPTVFDGAQWILEGVRENRYHVVDRTSPETSDYHTACLYLLKISGVKTDEPDLY